MINTLASICQRNDAMANEKRRLFFGGPINRGPMGWEREVDKFFRTQVLMLPKIAEFVVGAFEAKVFPGIVERLRRGIEIEEGDVDAIARFWSGKPDRRLIGREYGMATGGMLINADQLGIGERSLSPFVAQREISSHDERRTKDGPQGEKGALFIMRKTRCARLFPTGGGFQASDGKHVRIGPMAGAGERGPFRSAGELISDALRKVLVAFPDIPNVIRNTPHLRVAAQLRSLVEGRWAGREA